MIIYCNIINRIFLFFDYVSTNYLAVAPSVFLPRGAASLG